MSDWRVEDGSITDQEPVNSYYTCMSDTESIWIAASGKLTFRLDKSGNPQGRILDQIVLGPFDIRRNPIPWDWISNYTRPEKSSTIFLAAHISR